MDRTGQQQGQNRIAGHGTLPRTRQFAAGSDPLTAAHECMSAYERNGHFESMSAVGRQRPIATQPNWV